MATFLSKLAAIWQKSVSKAGNADEKGQPSFSVIQGEMDGHPLFAIIDMSLRNYKSKASLPWFLSISTPLINPTKDGLPTDKDSSALNEWEDLTASKIQAESRFVYVGHVTWNGSREALFYIEKQELVVNKLKKLADDHVTRPFAFRCEKDEKWDKVAIYFKQ
jgi:hypothetical protein